MRNNYHNPITSEDSVTKISRSKSRNQIAIVSKIKEKVSSRTFRNTDGMIASISNKSLSIIIRTSRIRSVKLFLLRLEKQTAHPRQKVYFVVCRNDKNDLSKAKRIHEPSLDKSSY